MRVERGRFPPRRLVREAVRGEVRPVLMAYEESQTPRSRIDSCRQHGTDMNRST